MLTCKEVSKLACEGLDRRLPLPKRIGVRMHLMMCLACSRFVKQVKFLRRAGRIFQSKAARLTSLPGLSQSAKIRIQESLRKK